MPGWADRPWAVGVVAAVALGLATAVARPYAGSWNDGSRLAAAESLIDRGTFAIDDSVYCRPALAGRPPYHADRVDLNTYGTYDKLFIDGHFHSDKPAVANLLTAAAYRPLMGLGFPSPGARPDVFAWAVTVLTSGVGYAVAVGCVWLLGRRLGLTPGLRLTWTAAFGLSTYALVYAEHVTPAAPQLAAVAGMILLLLRVADAHAAGRTAWGSLVGLGTLAGLGFNLDFASGPLFTGVAFAAVGLRTRRLAPLAVYSLAALPWVAAGVGLNVVIGGSIAPPNMNPAYFRYPGSAFTEENMTGFLSHQPFDQLMYAAAMLIGKHGFLTHNLPLLLAVLGAWKALRRPVAGRAELLWLLAGCGATWGMYAVLSNNMGGQCCSVRWFVPFLAPGWWLLGVLLRERPEYRPDFYALAGWGAVLGALMVWVGPWTPNMVPLLWPVVGAALLTWAGIEARRWRPRSALAVAAARRVA